jgi:energy-converting hydrogenase Eha subunit A
MRRNNAMIRAKLLGFGVAMAIGLMIWDTLAQRTKLLQSEYLVIAVIALHTLVAIALVVGVPKHPPSVLISNSWERLVIFTRWWLFAYCLVIIASKSYMLINVIAFRHWIGQP